MALLGVYVERIARELNESVGYLQEPAEDGASCDPACTHADQLDDTAQLAGACVRLPRRRVARNLVADAMRWVANSTIAVINGGAIRASIRRALWRSTSFSKYCRTA